MSKPRCELTNLAALTKRGIQNLLLQFAFNNLCARRRLEGKPSVADRDVFFLIRKPILGGGPVHPLHYQPDNAILRVHFQYDLANLVLETLRNAPQYHIAMAQWFDIR